MRLPAVSVVTGAISVRSLVTASDATGRDMKTIFLSPSKLQGLNCTACGIDGRAGASWYASTPQDIQLTAGLNRPRYVAVWYSSSCCGVFGTLADVDNDLHFASITPWACPPAWRIASRISANNRALGGAHREYEWRHHHPNPRSRLLAFSCKYLAPISACQ